MIVDASTTGTWFGRYRLEEHIGSGGMATVYRASTGEPPRVVVIKRILPALAADESFVKMLVAEGRLTARLHHANIVELYELGQVGEETFLAMEHVDGHDLHAVLRRARALPRPMPSRVAFYIVRELAAALAYAHTVTDDEGRPGGIVHRDLSHSNVMVTPDGAVKLLDFGVAKAVSSLRDEHTRTGTLKGKLAYMSPEQADGEPVDARSDIFSLGIVLHELLTMQRLFRADDDLKTLRLVREANVRAPSLLGADSDAAGDAVVLKMLARRADDRYASGEALLDELDPVAGTSADLARFLAELQPIGRAPLAAPKKPAGTRTFVAGVARANDADLAPTVADRPRVVARPRRALLLVPALGAIAIGAGFARHRPASPTVRPVVAPAVELAPTVVTAPAPPVVEPSPQTKPARRPSPRPAPHARPPKGLFDPFKR